VRRSVGEEFLASPDVQAALADVICQVSALLMQNWDSEHRLESRQSTGQWPGRPVWSRIVIGAVVLLAFNGKISSDSTTFLLGAAE
jgi:hypothetical protein